MRPTFYLYRISLRYDPANTPSIPDGVKTITYATTYPRAVRSAGRMERKLWGRGFAVTVDVEVMTRPAGLSSAEWTLAAVVGGRVPGHIDEIWRDGGRAFAVMCSYGDAVDMYDGPAPREDLTHA